MIKKVKRGGAPRVDNSRPSKPPAPAAGSRVRAGDVEPPAYDGPRKPDRKEPGRSNPHSGGEGPSKPAQEPARRPRAGASDLPPGDQIPPKARRGGRARPAGEQYIRLRVRVRGDQLSVLDSHLVDGPLGQITGFSGANAYEVSVGDRLLHAGSLPDLGLQRSFANPNGPADQRGHHFTDRSTYEFMARVPAHEVTPETIDRIAIRLHRIKEEARTDRLGAAPLAEQFARQVRPVAELVGLPASVLPEAIEERGGRTPSL
ncbi:MAG TPA: hypothetical protein VF612_07765 [Jatrophihabitans sp.]|jgi:hypothetical protein|uniref:hypothetical protein n=1 Tax=Jatrophihabitans sp. TaxID=1932789 RepID=UPI002F1CFB10